ncbi:hypothetical protein [Crenothrix sp.]|uniref:hypothetical protein n=1 Tax=Crenothrix sp. TaxID=3100433 RepID=UPI00374DF344
MRKTRHYLILALFATLLSLMPAIKTMAESLQAPQQVIQNVSEMLQKKLQDKSFTQNFAQVTEFVRGVIDPPYRF